MSKRLPILPWLYVVACLAMLWLSAGWARAASYDVKDNAKIFDAGTIEQVNVTIKAIKTRFDKDLTIETFAGIPENRRVRFAAEGKEAFFENWIRDEARQAETNGIFILVLRNPGRLQVAVGNKTRLRAFTDKDRDELRDMMLVDFGKKQFDQGLIEGSQFILKRLGQNFGEKVSLDNVPTTQPSQTQPATAPTTRPTSAATTAPATRPVDEFLPNKIDAATKPDSDKKAAEPASSELNK